MVKIILIIFLISFNASASNILIKSSNVISVYDGDTFFANIEGWPDIVGKNIGIRINGIDTPEIRGKCIEEISKAKEARAALVSLIYSSSNIELRNIKRGKYFRLVADVFANDKNVADYLINKKLAIPYDGGTKENFCLNKND